MDSLKKNFLRSKAQTISELAIFGAIVIFILGIIIRQSLNANYGQDTQMKALRLALSESFKEAEQGNASRNVASVIFVEDRKTAEVSEYGTLTRVPHIVSAAGSFSKNLFYPVDWQEVDSLPVMDMFINGKHLTFTTAGFRTYAIGTNEYAYKVVPNVPGSNEYDPNCADLPAGAFHCFDLDRNGTIDVPFEQRADFSWMWKAIKPSSNSIDFDSGENTSLDVDGDLKEEVILELQEGSGGWGRGDDNGPGGPGFPNPHPGPDDEDDNNDVAVFLRVMDQQAGDIDLTYDTRDKNAGRLRSGLTQETRVYSMTKPRQGDAGTVLDIADSSSRQQQNQIDVIEREIQLANNTGRMCDPAQNPAVEACGNCFSGTRAVMTCFDPGTNILYVRSRLQDVRGRIWVTPRIGQ